MVLVDCIEVCVEYTCRTRDFKFVRVHSGSLHGVPEHNSEDEKGPLPHLIHFFVSPGTSICSSVVTAVLRIVNGALVVCAVQTVSSPSSIAESVISYLFVIKVCILVFSVIFECRSRG